MAGLYYQLHIPFAILTYCLLLFTVVSGILKFLNRVKISTHFHRIVGILALVFSIVHGGIHLFWNNFQLRFPLVLGLIPLVLVLVNLLLGLSKLNSKVKLRLHITLGLAVLVAATFHAAWMLAQRWQVIS